MKLNYKKLMVSGVALAASALFLNLNATTVKADPPASGTSSTVTEQQGANEQSKQTSMPAATEQGATATETPAFEPVAHGVAQPEAEPAPATDQVTVHVKFFDQDSEATVKGGEVYSYPITGKAGDTVVIKVPSIYVAEEVAPTSITLTKGMPDVEIGVRHALEQLSKAEMASRTIHLDVPAGYSVEQPYPEYLEVGFNNIMHDLALNKYLVIDRNMKEQVYATRPEANEAALDFWGLPSDHIFPEYEIPQIPGYDPYVNGVKGTIVPALKVNLEAPHVDVNVTYRPNGEQPYIPTPTPNPDPNPDPTPNNEPDKKPDIPEKPATDDDTKPAKQPTDQDEQRQKTVQRQAARTSHQQRLFAKLVRSSNAVSQPTASKAKLPQTGDNSGKAGLAALIVAALASTLAFFKDDKNKQRL